MSTRIIPCSDDELVGALDALDVPFLMGGVQNRASATLTPAALMQGLVQSPEARVRSALIPLLLRHPEFAAEARLAAAQPLSQPERDTLQTFYTAALLLQRKYRDRLEPLFGVQPPLPDLFSARLRVDISGDPDESLQRLAQRHAQLTGLELNWLATFEHAAERLIKYSEKRKRWAQSSRPDTR